MEKGPAYLLRKIAIMALIGFLVMTLGGPALALLGVLLPFIIVGFLVWIVIRAAILGPIVVGRMLGRVVRRTASLAIAIPWWFVRKIGGGFRFAGRAVAGAGAVLIPIAAGAVVGGTLGAFGGMQFQDADMRVPAGAIIGAGVGLVTLLWRSKPSANRVVVGVAAPRTLERAV